MLYRTCTCIFKEEKSKIVLGLVGFLTFLTFLSCLLSGLFYFKFKEKNKFLQSISTVATEFDTDLKKLYINNLFIFKLEKQITSCLLETVNFLSCLI